MIETDPLPKNLLIDLNKNQSPNFTEQPIKLIDFVEGKFELNSNALSLLKDIKEDLIIVSIVGKARTGKSYLMNLLLDNIGKSRGFEVDSSIASCTKGIWIWGNVRKKPNGNAKMIFLDSEGTCSVDRSTKTYDSKIFALVVLISSLFIYNTNSVIDENGISELALAAHLSSSIATNSGINKEDLINELSPKFLWVIRDFTLTKVHPQTGQQIEGKEYLDVCLRKKISVKNSLDNNMIRDNILKYFKDRDCITLVRPLDSEVELRRLNEYPFSSLKSEFKTEFINLKQKVFEESGPKFFKGKKLDGPSLVNLLIEFLHAINQGAVPNINNVWDTVVTRDIEDFLNKALLNYKEKIKETQSDNRLNTLRKMFLLKNESLLIYNKCFLMNEEILTNDGYNDTYTKNLQLLEKEINVDENKILSNIYHEEKKISEDLLRSSMNEIQQRSLDNFYLVDDKEFIKRFYSLYQSLKGNMNCLELFTKLYNDNYSLAIKTFTKALSNHDKDLVLSIEQTYAKNVNSYEIILSDNPTLKEKIKYNLMHLDELKKKLISEKQNLDDTKRYIAELKIDIQKKKMNQKQDPIIKIYQKSVNSNTNFNSFLSENNPDGNLKTSFQSNDFSRFCDCKCKII